MDGHVAPLKDIVALANKYNALVFVDECPATGDCVDTDGDSICGDVDNCPTVANGLQLDDDALSLPHHTKNTLRVLNRKTYTFKFYRFYQRQMGIVAS